MKLKYSEYGGALLIARLTLVICTLLYCIMPAHAQAIRMRGPKHIAFLHATLIDGFGKEPIKDAIVIMEGNRIFTAGALTGEMNLPSNTETIDLTGKYIIPGLIDTHIHYESPRDLLQLLAWGVTSANCMFETVEQGETLAAQTSEDTAAAAQIYSTAPIFTARNGWWDDNSLPAGSAINRFPATPEEARAQVDKLSSPRIKLMYDNMDWCRNPRPTLDQMKPEVMRALISEAKKRNLFTEVHAPKLGDARAMLDAGVDAFAHGILDGAPDTGFISALKARDGFYVPTFCVFEFLADTKRFMEHALNDKRFSSSLPVDVLNQYQSREYFEHYSASYPNAAFVKSHLGTLRSNMAALHRGGVTVTMGTDMWAFPGIGAHLELEYMVAAGMTPIEAIIAATRGGGMFLHDDHLGGVGTGMRADLLVLGSNPLADIKNTRDIISIVKHGVIYDHKHLVEQARQWKPK